MELAVELVLGNALVSEVALYSTQALLGEGQVVGFGALAVRVGTNDDMEFGLFAQSLCDKGEFGLLLRG